MQHAQIEYPTDLHAPGAIDQLLAFHRQTFGGFRMEDDGGAGGDGGSGDGGTGGDGGKGGDAGGTGGDGGGDGGQGGSADDGDKDLGFPKDTPVAEMTDAQARRYFEHKASKEESRRKGLSKAVGGKTAEQIQADMAELEELRKGKLTAEERTVKEAEDRVRAEERVKAGERIAKVTFEGALSHLSDEDRKEVIDGLNLKSYIDEDGEVDTAKVRKYAAKIAPVATTTTRRDFGGGVRREGAPQRGTAGKAEADRRFGKSKSTAGA